MRLNKKNDIFLLEELVKRNFSSKYKDSSLGILWTILSPLLMIALFTIIFSTVFSRDISNFPVYFLCGWCIFSFFSGAISSSMNSIKGNKNILQRTPAPKYVFVLASIISEFITLIIMLILLIGVMLVTHAPFYFTSLLSVIPILSLLIMIMGLGFVLSVVSVYYSDVMHLWTVVSMMFMYASAIFYPMEIIPDPFKKYMQLNPFYWIIDQFRFFVYKGIVPPINYMMNSLLLSLIILVFGIIVFLMYEYKVALKF